MASAYAHAETGSYSREIDTLYKIERFGLEAILGRRTFYHFEMRRFIRAENIVLAYRSMKAAENWAAWSLDNPHMAEILLEAMKAND